MKKRNATLLSSFGKLGAAAALLVVFWGVACLVSSFSETHYGSFLNKTHFLTDISGAHDTFDGEYLVALDAVDPFMPSILSVSYEASASENRAQDLSAIRSGADFDDEFNAEDAKRDNAFALAGNGPQGAEFADAESASAELDPQNAWNAELAFKPIELPTFVDVHSDFWKNDAYRVASDEFDPLLSQDEMEMFVPSTLVTKDGATTYSVNRFFVETKAEASAPVNAENNAETQRANEVTQTSLLLPLKMAQTERETYTGARPVIRGGFHRHIERTVE